MFFLFDHVCTLLCDIVSFEEKSDIYNKNNEMGFLFPRCGSKQINEPLRSEAPANDCKQITELAVTAEHAHRLSDERGQTLTGCTPVGADASTFSRYMIARQHSLLFPELIGCIHALREQ